MDGIHHKTDPMRDPEEHLHSEKLKRPTSFAAPTAANGRPTALVSGLVERESVRDSFTAVFILTVGLRNQISDRSEFRIILRVERRTAS